ncbi:hypothetical protein LPJ61_000687 [Coemansia biformis]|uniref:Uncharacterized protein n=1 Tax=Coemansia biformis TaxID=1286918 RepID=A0A9W7YHE8_9FUNG|nr:hypothetical protein LPJ61_000687 [Coemansia biformis]
MYNSNGGGTHSYSTPSSPSAYCSASANGDGKAASDKELAALFRAAAANVTQLYREASSVGQSAYKAGYEQCYSDVWEFVLAAQSAGADSPQLHQQVLLQRLAEFARAKRLAVRHPHAGPAGGVAALPLMDDQARDQYQQTAGMQLPYHF